MTSKTEPRLLCYDLGEGVTAFSTTRHGGVSEANYASFNINPYCGDSADPVARATAAIHAGWRGTLQRICQRAVMAMQLHYGTPPDRLRAVVGPGISLANFEVGQEVYDQFVQAGFDLTETAEWHTKWHLDLPGINIRELIGCGVAPEHIHHAGICTFDHADDYFSARRLGIDSGRIYTGILMR